MAFLHWCRADMVRSTNKHQARAEWYEWMSSRYGTNGHAGGQIVLNCRLVPADIGLMYLDTVPVYILSGDKIKRFATVERFSAALMHNVPVWITV